jgi:DNA-directed RNA polymerase subunit RPC12/RpoP
MSKEISKDEEIYMQPLQVPIEVLFDQYKCLKCGKNSYINNEDKLGNKVKCLFCGNDSLITRQFQISIQGLGEYNVSE